ncbi:hypothetical protein ES703_39489 [subsurface metagenome]
MGVFFVLVVRQLFVVLPSLRILRVTVAVVYILVKIRYSSSKILSLRMWLLLVAVSVVIMHYH